ncbi:MAG: Flp pilus assembly complex ATPase component TadA [Pseudomonadales bacterium]|nr:Flp pilus assembly complex ATPase component TadA [Pseudomonadales bacterium]
MAEAAQTRSPVLKTAAATSVQLRPAFPLATPADFDVLRDEINACIRQRELRVVVELTTTRVLTSALLDFLLDMNDALRARGGWLQLSKINALCAEVLRITGVSTHIALLDVDGGNAPAVAPTRQRLGDMLVSRGLLREEQVNEALAMQKQNGRKLGEILINKRWVTEQDVLAALSGQLSIPAVQLRAGLFDASVATLLPVKAARRLIAKPLFRVRDEITVATPNAQNIPILKEIQELTGHRVRAVFAPKEKVLEFIEQGTEVQELSLELLDGESVQDLELVESVEENFAHIDEIASGSPIINLSNSLIQRAIREGASDIHIETFRDKGRVRFRIDGVLYEVMTLRAELMPALVSRLKVMANLDIAERRLPQDGRMQVITGGRSVDLRFSSLPGLVGEKVVLRILDKSHAILDVDQLGMAEGNRNKYLNLLSRGYGLILVTGPTGSGKTTSLYAALNKLNSLDRNIITIEDPVEYQMDIINQNEVRPAVGLGFATILKHVLRQDPDIIMVGEIREKETATIAVQAALTGHLVLSTLHTNDSVGAITRLIDMGIEPYLLSSALVGVMAQRLVRTICPNCRSTFIAPGELVSDNDFQLYADTSRPLKLAKGRGCGECYDSGYKGRAAIHEVLETSEDLQRLIVSSPNRDALTDFIREHDIRTLYQDGLRRVVAQETTVEEIKRVVNG